MEGVFRNTHWQNCEVLIVKNGFKKTGLVRRQTTLGER